MENKGGGGELPIEKPEGLQGEIFGGSTVPENRPEEMPGRVEHGPETGATEKQILELPVNNELVGSEDEEQTLLEVKRDAENISKNDTKRVLEIVRKYGKDPYLFQNKFTKVKWDYMRKAFNRDLGDGREGATKIGGNVVEMASDKTGQVKKAT